MKKKRLYFLADLWSQSEFRTQRNAERKTNIKSEMTQRLFVVKFMVLLFNAFSQTLLITVAELSITSMC